MPTIKLGELLVKANVLQESQLRTALAEQAKWGGRLGETLVRMSLVTEEIITKALSRQLGVQAVNLDAVQGIPAAVRDRVPAKVAKELTAVPLQLRDDGKTLLVAMAEPQNLTHLDTLRAASRCKVIAQLAGRSALTRAYSRFYQAGEELSEQESSFKLMDAQGRTVLKSHAQVEAESVRQASLTDVPAPSAMRARSPEAILLAVEEMQQQEVATLKAMVDLLISKGVFTRDEYLAKLKR